MPEAERNRRKTTQRFAVITPSRCCWTPLHRTRVSSIAGETLNASLFVLPNCYSRSGWASAASRGSADHFVPVTHPGFRPPGQPPASPTFHLHLLQTSLKLKEHIHTTSIYTPCFICYKISPLGFFFFFLCFVTAYYTSHERLMILNLACFKAFCSFVVSALVVVIASVPTASPAVDGVA